MGRHEKPFEEIPASAVKYCMLYLIGKIKTQKELALLSGVSRPTLHKYIKKVANAADKIAEIQQKKDDKELIKEQDERKKQERIMSRIRSGDSRGIRFLSGENLDILINEEVEWHGVECFLGEWQIGSLTKKDIPAIFERIRRQKEKERMNLICSMAGLGDAVSDSELSALGILDEVKNRIKLEQEYKLWLEKLEKCEPDEFVFQKPTEEEKILCEEIMQDLDQMQRDFEQMDAKQKSDVLRKEN